MSSHVHPRDDQNQAGKNADEWMQASEQQKAADGDKCSTEWRLIAFGGNSE
jgi:hypothetical protein